MLGYSSVLFYLFFYSNCSSVGSQKIFSLGFCAQPALLFLGTCSYFLALRRCSRAHSVYFLSWSQYQQFLQGVLIVNTGRWYEKQSSRHQVCLLLPGNQCFQTLQMTKKVTMCVYKHLYIHISINITLCNHLYLISNKHEFLMMSPTLFFFFFFNYTDHPGLLPLLISIFSLQQGGIWLPPSTTHLFNQTIPVYMYNNIGTVNQQSCMKQLYQLEFSTQIQHSLVPLIFSPSISRVTQVSTLSPSPCSESVS